MKTGNLQKEFGKLIEAAIAKSKTTAKCEDYILWRGVSVFVATTSGKQTDCAIADSGQYRIVVKNHRPHRIQISCESTVGTDNLLFNNVDGDRWTISAEVDPRHDDDAFDLSNSASVTDFLENISANIDPVGSEEIQTTVNRTILDPETLRITRDDTDATQIVVDLV